MALRTVGLAVSTEALEKLGLDKTVGYLKDEIGLNLLILSHPSIYWNFPKKPLPKKEKSVANLIEQAHRRDLDVWLFVRTFSTSDFQIDPDFMIRDVEGNFVHIEYGYGEPNDHWRWKYSWCPSNPNLRKHFNTLLADLAKSYELEGLSLAHFRYAGLGQEFHNLFACTCVNCAKAAAQLGYDFDRIKKTLLELLRSLKSLKPARVKKLNELELGFLDFLYLLGSKSEIIDWLNLRCDIMTQSMRELHDTAKSARQNVAVGADLYPPSFALFSGHKYSEIQKHADYVGIALNHPVFFILYAFADITKHLSRWNEGLLESDCLKLVYKLFGYDHFKMPDQVSTLLKAGDEVLEDTSRTATPLSQIIQSELRKGPIYSSQSTPLNAMVCAGGHLTPEDVRKRVFTVKDAGYDGIILDFSTYISSKEPGKIDFSNTSVVKEALETGRDFNSQDFRLDRR
jgi:hypothetical protein